MTTENKKRILILTLAWRPIESGGEIAPREIATRLSSYYEFDVLGYRFSKSHPKEEKTSYGTVYRIGGTGHSYAKKNLFSVMAGLKALSLHRANKYDAIWVIMATYNSGSALIFSLFNPHVPIILTLQEGDPFPHIYKRLGVLRPLWHLFFRRVKKVQAISKYLALFAKEAGFDGEPVVIGNGVEVSSFARPDSMKEAQVDENGPVVLVSHSRLVKKNAHDIVIKALALLSEKVVYIIVGGGEEEASLKELARSLGLERRVAFMGQLPIEKTPHYLHRAHIFVRPSRSEGLGASFLEAMAAGLPIIGTREGGIPDFLTDGETGLFCNVDDPESVARAVTRLIEDKALYSRISENGKRLINEKYTWDVISTKMKNEVFDTI